MNADDVIREIQENYAEWIEMSDDPTMFVAEVLAKKVINLQEHIQYLERRVESARTRAAK